MKLRRNYLLIPVSVILVWAIGSIFTSGGMDWYNQLVLPAGTPPGSVIWMVWTVIYSLAIVSLLIFWNKTKHDKHFIVIFGLFLMNGVLNAWWNWLFFTNHWLGISFVMMIVIWLLTFVKILLLWHRNKRASILLFPYPIWVAIAATFAYKIWMLN